MTGSQGQSQPEIGAAFLGVFSTCLPTCPPKHVGGGAMQKDAVLVG